MRNYLTCYCGHRNIAYYWYVNSFMKDSGRNCFIIVRLIMFQNHWVFFRCIFLTRILYIVIHIIYMSVYLNKYTLRYLNDEKTVMYDTDFFITWNCHCFIYCVHFYNVYSSARFKTSRLWLTIKKFSKFMVTSPPAVSKHGSEQRKVKNLNNLFDCTEPSYHSLQ